MKALLVGTVAGTLVTGFLMLRKKRVLDAQGGAIEAGLSQLGSSYAEQVAKRTADQYMADVYGLTPERIANIGSLAERVQTVVQQFRALGI